MIAIAGAKGGCGKTTTALGVAQALGRSGTQTIAVDADRHLPNLHVTADVDREPTGEQFRTDETAIDVAQRVSNRPKVNVLPAPRHADSATMQEQLRMLAAADASVVLDCPSGAGPDLADSLSVADAVVVVTTATDESLAAAAKTIQIARRLEVPVAGTVLTRSKTVPPRYEHAIDVPVLATVPDVEKPLCSPPACEAFDAVVTALESNGYLSGTIPVQNRTNCRLETGIGALDRKLEGGLEPGSIVALTAAPASQSELLLEAFATARPTVYLTTERPESAVSRTLEDSRSPDGSVTVRSVDRENTLEDVVSVIEALPEGSRLIVDTMDAIERSPTHDYVGFLADLGERMREIGAIAFVHCLKGSSVPDNRARTEHVADVVFDLRTELSGTTLETSLSIPKLRRGGRPAETISLDLTDRVAVDASRDIA